MPAWIVASSSDAAYWPSRYSSTYEGTTAFPRTALTRSLRTTAPAKCSLILSSSADFSGAASAGSAAARTSISPRASSRFVMSLLEVEVRRERPLDGVVALRERLPLCRVRDRLLEAQRDGPVVVLVGVLSQVQHSLLVTSALIVGSAVEGEDRLVGDQRVTDVEAEPDLARMDLVGDGLALEQLDSELAGGDLVGLGHEVDVDRANVALALLVDRDHRDDDLLERCSAVDIAGAGAWLRDAVDRLGNLDVDCSRKPSLDRSERHEGRRRLQRPAKYVPAIGLGDRVTLGSLRDVVRLLQGGVLIEKTVVGSD